MNNTPRNQWKHVANRPVGDVCIRIFERPRRGGVERRFAVEFDKTQRMLEGIIVDRVAARSPQLNAVDVEAFTIALFELQKEFDRQDRGVLTAEPHPTEVEVSVGEALERGIEAVLSGADETLAVYAAAARPISEAEPKEPDLGLTEVLGRLTEVLARLEVR